MNINLDRAKQITHLLLRVAAAYIFIQAGGLKLFGWFGGMPAGVEMTTLIWIAGILEVFGGLTIFAGLFTRPVAFILAGEMAVAYFIGHALPMGHALVPMLNQGQVAVLLCFIFLFLAAHGAGKWSIDSRFRHR